MAILEHPVDFEPKVSETFTENPSPPEQLQLPQEHAPDKRFSKTKKFLGRASLVTMVSVGSGMAGVTMTNTPVEIGPHTAHARLTFDDYYSIESTTSAPKVGESTSTLSMPADTFGGVGVNLSFNDLPVSITKNQVAPHRISQDNLPAYASLFANYNQDIQEGQKALRHTFELYAAMGSSLLMMGFMAKKQIGKRLGSNGELAFKSIGLALAAGTLATGLSPVAMDKVTTPEGSDISQDASLPVDGIRANGGLLDFIQQNKEYYDRVEINIRNAYKERLELFSTQNSVKVVISEGSKCRVGMNRITGVLTDVSNALFVISAGDDALGGTVFDRYCVQSLSDSISAPILKVDGQHDPRLSEEETKAMGITKLDGQPVQKAGLTVIGIGDPYERLSFEQADNLVKNLTRTQVGAQLAHVTCQEEGINIAVANQPSVVEEVALSGCADLVIAGGFKSQYKEIETKERKMVSHYLARSSSGATYTDKGDLATLNMPIVPMDLTIFTFDKDSGKPLYFEVITALPDSSVKISLPTVLPYARTIEGNKALFSKQ